MGKGNIIVFLFSLFIFLTVVFAENNLYSETSEHTGSMSSEQDFFQDKCSKCHEIDRAIKASETMNEEEFSLIVDKMSKKKDSHIDTQSTEKIIRWYRGGTKRRGMKTRLVKNKDVVKGSSEYSLFQKKCSKCHEIDRAIKASKTMTEEEFSAVVDKMSGKKDSHIDTETVNKIKKWHRGGTKRRGMK